MSPKELIDREIYAQQRCHELLVFLADQIEQLDTGELAGHVEAERKVEEKAAAAKPRRTPKRRDPVAASRGRADLVERIEQAIREHGPLTPLQIASALELPRTTISSALSNESRFQKTDPSNRRSPYTLAAAADREV